jgi:hypothetical protein
MSYADNLVLLANEEMVQQGVTDNCKIPNEKLKGTIPSTDYDRSKTMSNISTAWTA